MRKSPQQAWTDIHSAVRPAQLRATLGFNPFQRLLIAENALLSLLTFETEAVAPDGCGLGLS